MYKTLLSDYDHRQRELLLENAELRKVLQQMKKDMVFILSSRKTSVRGDKPEDRILQVGFFFFSLTSRWWSVRPTRKNEGCNQSVFFLSYRYKY